MTEKRNKVNVEDIIGLIETDEPVNSVEEVRKLRGRENEKRFSVSKWTEHWQEIVDNGKILSPIQVCDLLNTFHEENQKMEKKLRFLNELNEPYGVLIEENQRLKSFIKRLRSCDGKIYLMNGMVCNTKMLNFE